MKRILPVLALMILISSGANKLCSGQGMYNLGATITITAGAVVYIDGDALGKYTNQTNAGVDGKIDLNGSMYVEGDWVNDATGNYVFINNTAAPWGTVYLNGAVASNIGGVSLTEFENLYIQNANRTLQITNSEVNNILTLNNAGMILNQNRFIIDNSAAAGITTVGNGFVRSENTTSPFGEIQWNIGSTNGINYIIPFATAAPVIIPLTFSPTAGTSGNLVVATYPTNAANIPYPPGVTHVQNYFTGANNSAMTVDRFWEIVVPGALTSANINFRCTPAEATGIPNPRAQRWIPLALAWEYPLQGAQVTAATGTDVTGITGHNTWWTLANITSPLPVELISFDAVCNNNFVQVEWATASETDNKYFTVEKSRDGNNFESFSTIPGNGNSSSVHNYSVVDKSPFAGKNYYRLKQTDYNGQAALISSLMQTNDCSMNDDFNAKLVYSIDYEQISVNAPADEKFTLSIFDATGRLIHSNPAFVNKGYNEIKLNTAELSSAVYFIHLQGTEHFYSDKFAVR